MKSIWISYKELKNKNFRYRLYLALLCEARRIKIDEEHVWGLTLRRQNNFVRKYIKQQKTTMKSLRKYINEMCKSELIELNKNRLLINREIAQKGKFVVAKEETIMKLLEKSEMTIRLYVLLLKLCREGSRRLTRDFLLKELGYSEKSNRLFSQAVKELKELNILNVHREYETGLLKCKLHYTYSLVHEDLPQKEEVETNRLGFGETSLSTPITHNLILNV